MKKILLAMSGGVDSSAALVLLKNKYEVIGATLTLHGGSEADISAARDAKQNAEKFGVPHYVCDLTELFREKVIGNFVNVYERGGTPNPCVDCNIHVKFGGLMEFARSLGCEMIATGHYARTEAAGGRVLLKKAMCADGDNDKDQSYMLYGLTQEQLSRAVFPLGELKKSEVRELAADSGLISADKAESQDICFVPDGDYAAFIEKFTGRSGDAGDVIDSAGNKVGRHGGLIRYTVGQRRGLGIAFGRPAYVIGKNAADNTLIVGPEAELFSRELTASRLNWISFPELTEPIMCKAKIRYRMAEQPCAVYPLPDGRAEVAFGEPQRAITPGQSVVFYDSDTVIGGGIIE